MKPVEVVIVKGSRLWDMDEGSSCTWGNFFNVEGEG
jgi:hypothetical protein